jgi:curved DNA-binding protein CbpA
VAALDEVLRDAGDLSRIPLSRVLYAVFETKRTGCLTVATATGKVHFYFFRGEMVYLTSEREQDSLIHSMARRGMLEVLNLPPGDRPDNLEDEIGLLMATRALQPHKIPSVLEDLLLEILEGIGRERSGIYRLLPADPPHRFMEAYSPVRLLRKLHLQHQATLDSYMGHKADSEIVVRIPLSIDLGRWKLPSIEQRLATRLRTMVGREISVEDFLRVYGEGEVEHKDRVRAFLSLLTDIGYLDFRPPAFSSEDKLALQELLVEAHRIRKLNHFQLLRVRATDPEDKLKQAHLAAAKTYHPDHFFQRPDRVRAVAAVIQGQYQEAHDTLKSEGGRKRYLASLGDGELEQAGVSAEELHDPKKASILMREAERFMKVAKWPEAEHYMREAIRYDSDRAGYVASLGWILFNLDPRGNRPAALDQFRQALEISNNCDRAHYYRGILAKQDGNASKAELHFSRALAANPDNYDAKREMRLLQRRGNGHGDEEKGGVLASLFARDLFGRKKKK